MKNKRKRSLTAWTLTIAFFVSFLMVSMRESAQTAGLREDFVQEEDFRSQHYSQELLNLIQKSENIGEDAGLYLLESEWGIKKISLRDQEKNMDRWKKKWKKNKVYPMYRMYMEKIWNDVVCFPVPKPLKGKKYTVMYEDSWMNERTYGGRRGHEGTDIMMRVNQAGIYPVISMTDGVVTRMGWLEKGGYRIGITAPGGAYFYYAHLDSYANLKEKDQVKAGQILGFAGDSGYGKEGTTGKFPVHLHVGIYLHQDEEEISVNPYWILRYLEVHKRKYSF